MKRLPLHHLHESLGAKIADFAGWTMPMQYPRGIMGEHLWCRDQAGLFDVSHMGQLRMDADQASALEALMPVDILDLAEGRQRYGLLTNAAGGVLDDLMLARLGDEIFIVVNAGRAEADIAHLTAHIDRIEVLSDRALLAVQGPAAESVVAAHLPEVTEMRFMDAQQLDWDGAALFVTRSGYTGEDGFEISVPAARVEAFAQLLLEDTRLEPIGLGARDTLRLEAGLPLYGNDLDEDISPVEAGLAWAISRSRRPGGARSGGYPGDDVIEAQMADGASRRAVALRPEGRAPMRRGVTLYDAGEGGRAVGEVTSGGFGPTVGGPVALALVEASMPTDAPLWGDVRGKLLPVAQTARPFVPRGYKR
ncbi:MAG: glycine cleavage system aminomethyltransferase GcvT [Pseudomonadota bacterium]